MAAAIARSAFIALAGCLLLGAAGCTSAPVAPPWRGLDAEPGQRLTVLSEETVADPDVQDDEDFLVFAAVAMPDGTVAVTFDPRSPQVGGDGGDGAPRTVILGLDGSRTPVEPGSVAGREVDPTATRPIAAGPDGTLYLVDPPAGRIVAGTPGGRWRTFADVPGSSLWSGLKAAVGPDGALYYATPSTVRRLDQDGTDTLVAGVAGPQVRNPRYNELGRLPRPATSAPLPELTAVVVGSDGTVYIATERTSVLALRDGSLVEVPGTRRDQLPLSTVAPELHSVGHHVTTLGLDVDGALLLGDAGQAQVLRMDGGRAEPIDSDAYAIAEGQNVALSPNHDLTIITQSTYTLTQIGR